MARPDRALQAGSTAHYEDAAYYTQNYKKRVEDIAYYVKLARNKTVLEFGAGNGRITLPMARAGATVCAIDASTPMMADLKSRLKLESAEVAARVQARLGDMRKARLNKQFDLVIAPFNTVLHLYTRADLEAFFATVHVHLAPKGLLAVDLSVPVANELSRDPQTLMRTPPFNYPGVGNVRYGERFDYDALSQVLYVSMEFEPKDPAQKRFVTPLCHRQYYPQEWMNYLHYNGFALKRVFGDFDGGAFTKDSDSMVCVAQASKPSARGGRK
jgi:SAM-dependent methyltransferase